MRQIDADALMESIGCADAVKYGNRDRAEQDISYRTMMLYEIRNEIDAQPTVGGWISVKDRLPEEPGRYLCWFGKNTFAVGASIVPYIQDLHWFASLESLERYENVTHWMPLPEPPEEEAT